MKLFIQQGDKNKFIGQIINGNLIKKVKKSKHLHRATQSWAIDSATIEQYKNEINNIIILDQETGTEYNVSINSFLQNSFEKDYGFGRQRFLPLKYWSEVLLNNPQLELSFGV